MIVISPMIMFSVSDSEHELDSHSKNYGPYITLL